VDMSNVPILSPPFQGELDLLNHVAGVGVLWNNAPRVPSDGGEDILM